MAEGGFAFVGAQLLLAFFVWRFSSRKDGSKVTHLPGGAKLMVATAFILVGTEVLALGVLGQKAWADVYFTSPKPDALQVQAQAGQFAFYFRYPGADGKFAPFIRTRSTKETRITLGSTRPMTWKPATTS